TPVMESESASAAGTLKKIRGQVMALRAADLRTSHPAQRKDWQQLSHLCHSRKFCQGCPRFRQASAKLAGHGLCNWRPSNAKARKSYVLVTCKNWDDFPKCQQQQQFLEAALSGDTTDPRGASNVFDRRRQSRNKNRARFPSSSPTCAPSSFLA